MNQITLDASLTAWRDHARALAAAHVRPHAVTWVDLGLAAATPLFGGRAAGAAETTPAPPKPARAPHVPRAFLPLAKALALHRDPVKWDLLYRLLFRLTHGEKTLLDDAADRDVALAAKMRHDLKRDIHKMHAFVRFNAVPETRTPDNPSGERYVAFFEPDHLITVGIDGAEGQGGWFARRFPQMHFSILTPDGCVHWNTRELSHTPGVTEAPATDDDLETLWVDYYRAIFNPARVNPAAMTREMPRRYWKHLPEAEVIPELLKSAPAVVDAMATDTYSAAPYVPPPLLGDVSLDQLAEAAQACEGCPLHGPATQTVFGQGPPDADVVLVGEQPGDKEDLAGEPFVGPAGQKLNEALEAAGIDRGRVYVTNAVKHFKFEPRGKFRLHKSPTAREVSACMPWLEAELDLIKPRAIVALGATAGKALFGSSFRITQQRGEPQSTRFAPNALATYHPSAILRTAQRDPDAGAQIEAYLKEDLASIAKFL